MGDNPNDMRRRNPIGKGASMASAVLSRGERGQEANGDARSELHGTTKAKYRGLADDHNRKEHHNARHL